MRQSPLRPLPTIALALASLAALGACSPLTQSPSDEAVYRLSPEALPEDTLARLPGPLTLDRVTVAGALNTDRIHVSRGEQRVDHYANARWASPLPDALTDAIGRILGDTALAKDPDIAVRPGHYRLRVRARDFAAHYPEGSSEQPPELRVTLILTLVDADRQVAARRRIERRAAAQANRLDAVVAGLETMLRATMRDGITELAAARAEDTR